MSFSEVMKKAFPFISAAASLGGPVGTIAATLVGKAIGVDNVEPTSDGISNAIATAFADPTQRAALIKAEQDFQAQMAELGYKDAEALAATAAADRASAREMQIQTKSILPGVLAVLVTFGFFGLLGLSAFHTMPKSSEKILDVMTGSLGTAWIMIITYYFGSSAGSDRKTELLAQAPPVSSK
jgi:hypothetical protein